MHIGLIDGYIGSPLGEEEEADGMEEYPSSSDESSDESESSATSATASSEPSSDSEEDVASQSNLGQGTSNPNGDDEEEDSVVAAIIRAKDKPSEKPPDVDTEDHFVDISFHPGAEIIAGASIAGDAVIYKYSMEKTEVVATYELHTRACRGIEYSDSGDLLVTVSADKSIMVTDTESGKLRQFYDDAHEDPLYSLAVINDNLIATGDENGVVRLWDLRQRTHVFSSKKMEDYVSKILTNEEARYLVCVSGEGSVTSFDIAAKCVHIQSETYEADFTCAGLIRKETKLVVGSSRGSLVFYKWGEFGLHTDELPWPKKTAINCLVPISENIVITGWEDGQIRATYLYPHKQLGVVGHHSLSVEALDISHDGAFIASSSIDQKLRFWPISFFEDPDFLASVNKKSNQRNLPSSNVVDRASFFAGLM